MRKRTTPELREAIQSSDGSIRALAARYGVNAKTIIKWRRRRTIDDLKTGPKAAVGRLSSVEEALVLAFRCHVALPLDDSLAALRRWAPSLTRSSLHRCWQRQGVSRAPQSLRAAPIDAGARFHIDSTEFGPWQLMVAVEVRSKFVVAQLCAPSAAARDEFLQRLLDVAPVKIAAIEFSELWSVRPAAMSAARGLLVGQRRAPRWTKSQLQQMKQRIRRAAESAAGVEMSKHELTSLQSQLAAMLQHFNANQALKTLGGFTPLQYLIQSQEATSDTGAASVKRASKRRAPRKHSKLPRRDSRVTRETILEAARISLAHAGPEGVSLAEVARRAGVNRGTAYQHFKTRENLIAATAEWVSDKMFNAVIATANEGEERSPEKVDVARLTDRLANFAMDNPELCRAWLLKVLSSSDPAGDRFWREYEGSTARFAATKQSQERVDTEVLSVIMLAGAFLWPIWARARAQRPDELRSLAHRFAQECLRISMYGNLRSERYPEVAARLRNYRFQRGAKATQENS